MANILKFLGMDILYCWIIYFIIYYQDNCYRAEYVTTLLAYNKCTHYQYQSKLPVSSYQAEMEGLAMYS